MTDERLEQIVGNLLRVGVSLAAAVAAFGGVWYLAAEGSGAPSYRHFAPAAVGLRALGALPAPLAVVYAGLLLLIATPVARVAFTLAVFAIRRDHAYTIITLAVLAVLLYSIGTSWL